MAENNNNTCSTPAQILCVKGCGFFGSASTMNMCSKCFREHEKTAAPSTPTPAPSSAPAAPASPPPGLVAVDTGAPTAASASLSPVGAGPTAAAAASSLSSPAPLAPMMPKVGSGARGAFDMMNPKASAELKELLPEDAQDVAAAGPPPRKIQKNHGRCWSCRRKVGLLGFRCKCDYTFCSEHRYSDKHDCSFDFKTEGMAQLQKDNPVVVADKMDRI